MNQDQLKAQVGQHAVDYIDKLLGPASIIGVGTGSTANCFIDSLAKIKHKFDGAVASSNASAERLASHGIPVYELNDVNELLVYVDGADEANSGLELIKGGGVDAMTRYMAGIGGADRIRVNGVRPGQIMTPGATRGTITDPDGGHHAFEGMFDLMQMLEGPGYPIDVANLVLFLSSDESRFITGQIIHIDGGTPVKI